MTQTIIRKDDIIMVAVKSLPNGYIKQIYLLGNKEGNMFINHRSSILIPDPLKSKEFTIKKDALDYNEQNKNKYKEELYPHLIRITIELI